MTRLRTFRRGDAGFTLIELVISIAIMGVITLPLANLVLSYFQNTVTTQDRVSVSHDEQIAAAYFSNDVASLGQHNSDGTTKQSVWTPTATGAPITCGSGISPFLALAWDDYSSAGALTTSEAVYGTRSQGGALQLVRLHCSNSSSTPDSTAVLADNLAATPTVSCDVACTNASPLPSVVTMTLSLQVPGHTATANTVTLTGQRRQT